MAIQPKISLRSAYTPCRGGEDLITPTIEVKLGRASPTQNYELDKLGRFRLIGGYEAFDGRPKPSEASYWILDFDAGTIEISIADIVDGAGGTSAEALIVTLESGTWLGGDAAGFLVLFNLASGVYVNNEILSVSGTPQAIANGIARPRDAETDTNDSIWHLAAIEATRADIGAVPGSGNVLGQWQHNGVKYAFRNNAAGTAAVMHKATTSGWTAVDLEEKLSFDTGTVAFVEGEVVTDGATAAFATVRRVYLTSGSWAGNDAAGYFTITDRTGNFGANAITGSASGAAVATGIQTANVFLPGGRFEFKNNNFGGHASTKRMYGCDGVNKAFEFDGTYFIFITTGMTTDTPNHLNSFKQQLFLFFSGGSAQHSAPGTPYVWSVVVGAGELGMGDEITGSAVTPDTLTIFSRNSTQVLYGSGVSDWELRPLADDVGAIEWTIQELGTGIYLDDRGLTSQATTQRFGDFKSSTISEYIDPFLQPLLGSTQGSMRVKEKNQYRLFFNDNRAITLTLEGDKVIGFTRQLYDVLPVCSSSTENSAGKEELFFGSEDGFVYQMDSGASFNGNPIVAVIIFHYNNLETPRTKKRIRRVVLELEAPANTFISMIINFNYGASGNLGTTFSPANPGAVWGLDNWGAFEWGGADVASPGLDVDGTGTDFSLTISYSGVFELQDDEDVPRSGLTGAGTHTIQGYTTHYNDRGVQR